MAARRISATERGKAVARFAALRQLGREYPDRFRELYEAELTARGIEQRTYAEAMAARPLQPCGTWAAYLRHTRHKEPVDDACRAAAKAKSSAQRATLRKYGR